MQYELTKDEIDVIEKYRNLLPEYQKIAVKRLDAVFAAQTEFIKLATSGISYEEPK